MKSFALALFLLAAPPASAQDVPLIDVEDYDITARVDLLAQTLEAEARVRFTPREATNMAVFELRNGLNVDAAQTADGSSLNPLRYRQDSTIHLSFPQTLPAGEPQIVDFRYGGRLKGYEESPVEGYSLAQIDADRAFLLYGARWFPVNAYGADRFTSKIRVITGDGMKVLGSGIGLRSEGIEGVEHAFEFSYPSFPGTIAIVPDNAVRTETGGTAAAVYFDSASQDLAREYGEAAGEIINFYSGLFGAPYSKSLAIVEIDEYAPNGYWAPGMIFLNPYGIGPAVNRRLLGTLAANQWWGALVGPGNRNHLWLVDGLAYYSALLEIEEMEGEEAFDARLSEARIESLTYNDIPMTQTGRLTDFSPEMHALAGARGVMVLHMLRWTVGDDAFFEILRKLPAERTWKSITTDDFRELAENVSGKDLDPFFLQWTESTETPEFKQEYTIYRLGGGEGFRIIGKVRQDMDTFSMPVEIKIETEGEPEYQTINVVGSSSDYSLETFGKPSRVILDPRNRILRFDDEIRVQVAVRKGEQIVELGYYQDALLEYQRALDINRFSSLTHYRIGEVFFLQNNYQSAANEFREALNGDREPPWTEVWAHIHLGKIFDITGQRERAVNEYQLAIRTRDDTQGAQNEARKYLESPYRRPKRQETIY